MFFSSSGHQGESEQRVQVAKGCPFRDARRIHTKAPWSSYSRRSWANFRMASTSSNLRADGCIFQWFLIPSTCELGRFSSLKKNASKVLVGCNKEPAVLLLSGAFRLQGQVTCPPLTLTVAMVSVNMIYINFRPRSSYSRGTTWPPSKSPKQNLPTNSSRKECSPGVMPAAAPGSYKNTHQQTLHLNGKKNLYFRLSPMAVFFFSFFWGEKTAVSTKQLTTHQSWKVPCDIQ